MRELRDGLAKLGGLEVSDDAIRRSIAVYNENRRWVNRVYDFRADFPWKRRPPRSTC